MTPEQPLQVIAPGQHISINNLQGIVCGVTINLHNYIQYKCIWYDGNLRKCEWVEEFEIELTTKTKIIYIGFNR